MLADAGRELTRVVQFARPELVVDEARIAAAVEHARFDRLQEIETAQTFCETPLRAKRFFRHGRAGDWRNHLSKAEVHQLQDTHCRVMARFGYHRLGEAA